MVTMKSDTERRKMTMSERIQQYKEEINRLYEILKKEDPKGDHYGRLLGKIKAYEELIASLERQQQEADQGRKEFDFKTESKRFEQDMARARFEKEREDAHEQQRVNEKRIENDMRREQISAGKDLLNTFLRSAFALGGSYLAAKVTWGIASGIFSEETEGNLVNSRLMGFISKPNLFNMFKF
jgi:hypothetical protein